MIISKDTQPDLFDFEQIGEVFFVHVEFTHTKSTFNVINKNRESAQEEVKRYLTTCGHKDFKIK